MRKLFAVSLCLLLGAVTLSAQNLTSNAAYKAYMDSLSAEFSSLVKEWNQTIPPHLREAMRLEREAKAHPELQNSLLAIAAQEREIAQSLKPSLQAKQDQNQEHRREIQNKYSLVFEDAFLYFNRRQQITKDSLSAILKSASAEIRKSPKGKALKKYIKNDQLADGQKFKTFRCYDANGKRFDWSLCKGKKVFLIHDGLWCITHGMDNSALSKYLKHITEASPECLPLIFVDCGTKEELQKNIEVYGLQEYLVVSEFQQDLGVLNWLYNDIVTPTCHYLDEQGILVKTTEGIDPDYLEKEFLRIKK